MTDSTILSAKQLLDSAKSLALEMRGSSAEVGNVREAAAVEVDGIIEDLRSLLNTEFNGKYIFSGHMIEREPFVRGESGVSYRGDDSPFSFRIGPDRLIEATVPGSRFMELGQMMGNRSSSLHVNVSDSTRLQDLNGGAGINGSRFNITDTSGTVVHFDIAMFDTLGDVVDLINSVSFDVTASIGSGNNGIILTNTGVSGEIVVEEEDSNAAADLGILGVSSGGTLRGESLAPELGLDTLISDIDLLDAGVDNFNITIEDETYTVDFHVPDYPVTMGDFLDRISESVPSLEAKINQDGDGFTLISEESFTVSEHSAATADHLGLLGGSMDIQPYSLFGTMFDFMEALRDNDTGRIEDVIGELDHIIDGILEIDAEVGSKASRTENILSELETSKVRLEEDLSLVEDVNIAEVLTDLSEAKVVYQAALQTASSIYDLSLLNYMS
jgi:flagellar hook-associated protein 3